MFRWFIKSGIRWNFSVRIIFEDWKKNEIEMWLNIILGTIWDTFGKWKYGLRGKDRSSSSRRVGYRLRRWFLECSCYGDLQVFRIQWACSGKERWIFWTGRGAHMARWSKFHRGWKTALLTIRVYDPLKWSKIERSFICTSHSCGLCSVLIKSEFIPRTKVFCYGNETQLNRCEHNHWGEHNCNHEEDAGVICTPGDVNDSKVNRNIPSRWRDSLIVS